MTHLNRLSASKGADARPNPGLPAGIEIPAQILFTFLFTSILSTFSCTENRTPRALPPPPLHSSKNWKVEVDVPRLEGSSVVRQGGRELLIYKPTTGGVLISTSEDGGRSWSQTRLVSDPPGVPVYLGDRFVGKVRWRTVFNGGQCYFQTWNADRSVQPSGIRDTRWGDFTLPAFATDSVGNYYAAWIDWRNGNPDVYFSSSFDGGRTWNANVRIDGDQSGQEQAECKLLSTPGGVLYAFWHDNRSPNTLFDIYCSSSRDGGRSWAPGVKVNDDTCHVWQISPRAVVDRDGTLYVAWVDYRDREMGGDITANIFFARSQDGGRTWCPNVAISHARVGRNENPVLVLGAGGQLLCAWVSTEDNLHGDIMFSYSIDRGRIWSAAVRVNDDMERVRHEHPQILPRTRKEPLLAWLDWREGQASLYMAELLTKPDIGRQGRQPRMGFVGDEYRGFTFRKGRTLFYDRCVSGPSPRWQLVAGTWVCVDSSYVSFGEDPTMAVAGSESWQDYGFEGSFLLDPLAHDRAYVYVRVSQDGGGRRRYYRLSNVFRQGVSLEYFDGERFIPLADAPFFFQKNTWYEFRTITRGRMLKHFIGDSLVIATEAIDHLCTGKVGVGSSYAPTYFRELTVSELRPN